MGKIKELKLKKEDYEKKDIKSLEDRPNLTAAQLKAAFDKISEDVIGERINQIIDNFEASDMSEQIGIEPISGVLDVESRESSKNIQSALKSLKKIIDDLSAGSLTEGSVTEEKIADESITTRKIANGAITEEKIADKVISPNNINYLVYDREPGDEDINYPIGTQWNTKDAVYVLKGNKNSSGEETDKKWVKIHEDIVKLESAKLKGYKIKKNDVIALINGKAYPAIDDIAEIKAHESIATSMEKLEKINEEGLIVSEKTGDIGKIINGRYKYLKGGGLEEKNGIGALSHNIYLYGYVNYKWGQETCTMSLRSVKYNESSNSAEVNTVWTSDYATSWTDIIVKGLSDKKFVMSVNSYFNSRNHYELIIGEYNEGYTSAKISPVVSVPSFICKGIYPIKENKFIIYNTGEAKVVTVGENNSLVIGEKFEIKSNSKFCYVRTDSMGREILIETRIDGASGNIVKYRILTIDGNVASAGEEKVLLNYGITNNYIKGIDHERFIIPGVYICYLDENNNVVIGDRKKIDGGEIISLNEDEIYVINNENTAKIYNSIYSNLTKAKARVIGIAIKDEEEGKVEIDISNVMKMGDAEKGKEYSFGILNGKLILNGHNLAGIAVDDGKIKFANF